MGLDIATVPQMSWDISDNSAEELVTELMGYLKEKSEESFIALEQAIDNLSEEITTANLPTTAINYDHVTDEFEIGETGTKPTPPIFPSTSGVDKPSRPDIEDVILPIFPTIPHLNEPAPTDTFDYTEDPYHSDILTQLKSSILGWLTSGGVEMDSMIQGAMDATWARTRSRVNAEWSEEQRQAMGFYPSRRWNLHNGATNAILARISNKYTRILLDKESEITAMEAQLKIDNRKWTVDMAVKFETALMEFADKTATRLFEAAKTTIELLYQIYKYKVDAYVSEVQGLSVEIDAKTKIIDAQLGINKDKVDIYTAELGGYKTELDSIISVIDGEARLYTAEVGGYEADIKKATAELSARVEKLKALIAQSTDLTELQVKEAEVNLQAYLGSLGLNTEAAKAVAGILGQIAASSLGALNTHTTMGDSTSRQFSSSYSHSEGIQNSKSHTFSESSGE